MQQECAVDIGDFIATISPLSDRKSVLTELMTHLGQISESNSACFSLIRTALKTCHEEGKKHRKMKMLEMLVWMRRELQSGAEKASLGSFLNDRMRQLMSVQSRNNQN